MMMMPGKDSGATFLVEEEVALEEMKPRNKSDAQCGWRASRWSGTPMAQAGQSPGVDLRRYSGMRSGAEVLDKKIEDGVNWMCRSVARVDGA
jgi:hypothetical protein